MQLSQRNMRYSVAAFWILVSAVWFALGTDFSAELFAWDEQIYFSAASNVLEGYWLLPRLSEGTNPLGHVYPFLEKPPLAYWIQAMAMAIGGKTPTAARLPSLLAISSTIGFTVLLACRLSRLATGVVAGVVALAVPAFSATRSATEVAVDPFLLFFGTGAIYCLIVFVETGQNRWAWLAGFGYGAAILTKFAAAAPFGLFTLPYLYRYRNRIDWRGFGRVVVGGVLIAAPWFVVVTYLEFQELLDQMVLSQVVDRATGDSFVEPGEPIFSFMRFPYFRMTPIYFGWPLAGLGVAFFVSLGRKRLLGEFSDIDVLMWPFAIGVIVLYAVGGGNHIWYILPAAVPITIIVADAITVSLSPILENLDISEQEEETQK